MYSRRRKAILPAQIVLGHVAGVEVAGGAGLPKSLLPEGVPDGFRVTLGTAECGQWMLVV
jgi:hypothetical protein